MIEMAPETARGLELGIEGWLEAVAAHFGCAWPMERLVGEYDLNFRARGNDGPIIVKVMRAGCDPAYVAMQIEAIHHALSVDPHLPLPEIVGEPLTLRDDSGQERIAWAQRALPGKALGALAPQSLPLLEEFGRAAGRLSRTLQGFEHPQLDRPQKWQLPDGGWIAAHLPLLPEARRHLVQATLEGFEELRPALERLPQQAIHNDLNDWNILIRQQVAAQTAVAGFIDFGDMTRAPVICDLAIMAAYAILDRPDAEQALAALTAGYHAAFPLAEAELAMLWPLVRMRLAVSVVNSTVEAKAKPDDPYVTISQAPAWRLLERTDLDAARILQRLRLACGLPVTPEAPAILAWLAAERHRFSPVVDADVAAFPVHDLSPSGSLTPENPFALTPVEAATLGVAEPCWIGRHGEPRLVYTEGAFVGPTKAANRRTVHLGVDLFAPAGAALRAPLAGTVITAGSEEGAQGYGGMVVLRHDTPAGSLFTLWGHLAADCARLKPGQRIAAGEVFAHIGTLADNGGWAPHLHLQMGFDNDRDWDGVADADDRAALLARFPNPAALLNLADDHVGFAATDEAELLDYRQAHFAANLKLSYRQPVMFVRGWRHHLFDQWGRPYLDAYNNVPHVGHAHPRIRAVAASQLARMNANTRYLHPAQRAFAQKLISKMPAGLEVCFFVNSGSEANELALRLARAASGGYDIVTPDHGYHGNTTGATAISAYKFNKPGMGGRQPWVHLVDVADDYRGRFRADDPACGERYAAQVDDALEEIAAGGGRLAGFIGEVFPSVGGQVIPPAGYLASVYARIRAAGGICIADEVQTGLGRLGDAYFAFEQQGVVPDIVVLGKPIGNGHPLGVVITTREIADRFARGAEFFSTFGGSNLSCLIGKEVLDIVDDEGLQQNAAIVGDRLLSGLRALQDRHACIGEVRGFGLFTGVDLVEDRDSRAPATAIADHAINRLREMRILIGREGPADNVLKIRPPLTIDAEGVDMICAALDTALAEIQP
ncbi:MAG: aminotransferase class III-fold pyridoxal phosphate-dependent enzyme [Mesorhizobium sp.]